MSSAGPVRVRALSFHASYRCRHSGACCTSGWEIAVEPAIEEHLRSLERVGERALRPRPGLSHGARFVLQTDAAGRCAFLQCDGLCAVHARLGAEALPAACRQFPRVVTLTPLGVSVTLSHYCPTAAGLVITNGSPPVTSGSAGIVLAPPAFPASWPFEGLDARSSLPPLLRPGVLMTWRALERWEEHAVATLVAASSPESALVQLAVAAERARAWTPAEGDFDAFFESCLRLAPDAAGVRGAAGASTPGEAWGLVAASVVAPELLPPPPPLDDRVAARLAAGWPSLEPVVARWLASKAFASWLALQGGGLRTTVRGLQVALELLRAEAGRGCAEHARAVDAWILREALRRADLLLVHLADPDALARRLSRCETAC